MIFEPHSFHSEPVQVISREKSWRRAVLAGGRSPIMPDNNITASLVNRADGGVVMLPDIAIFGRKPESTICLPDNRVSRRHAMIRRQEEGEYWFYDLGSFNGSYINGERVTTVRQLENGDVIRICDFEYSFDLQQPDEEENRVQTDMQVVPMIILVSDIKGFTRLSEVIPHDELAQAIGSWYGYCDQVLTEHGAAIDKFIGDAVLAYWTDTTPNARKWALSAAKYLRESCDLIQEQMKSTFDEHGMSFTSGVALHLGEVSWGQLGQGGLTMLGDAVNTTFRIQALTRSLGSDVVVSSDFLNGWKDGRKYCRALGTHELKGRKATVDLYAVEQTPDLFLRQA
jgi:adenylate cyclase